MGPDQQETPDLVTFTEEILNGKTAIFVQCVSRAIDAICWRLCFFFFNLHLKQTKCSVYLTNLFF